ncbi:MscS Mechanosensitive ion channel [Burkholderia sp. H160]|nr:MscS Mechanosensitive ion channel [Burkholderia sp. H160]
MRQVLLVTFRLIVLALTGLLPTLACSTATSPTGADGGYFLPVAGAGSDAAEALNALQAREDAIRQRASTATGDAELIELGSLSRRIAYDVDRLLAASLQPELGKTQAQLDVLGAAPVAGPSSETPAVARQRDALTAQQARLDAEVSQAEGIKGELVNFDAQIARLLHAHLKDQLALRTDSILSAAFWAPMVHPEAADYKNLRAFGEQVEKQMQSMWQPGRRITTTLLLLIALACATVGALILERMAGSVCLRRLPEGRLRRSAFAISTVFATLATTMVAIHLVSLAIVNQQSLSPALQTFTDELVKHIVNCALVLALGRAFLCTEHPTWRLPAIADPVAHALRSFPRTLAALLLFSGAIEQINRAVYTSLQLTIFTRGLVALIVALTIGASLIHANRVRTALAAAGNSPEGRSTLAGLIHAAVCVVVVGALAALLCGYISVARFLTYELVWFDIVLCSLYFLVMLTRDMCESVFSPAHASGNTIKHLFGLQNAHLAQISTLITGVCRSALIVAAVIALLTGGLGTTPADLIDSILEVLGGDRLRALNIVPAHIFSALLTSGVGLYLVRSVRKWFDRELLPKTDMSPGMRASLLTLFANIGYALVVLQTLSVLGVRWHNLAWIVSALSVGIGFGLQEIVKNFISGLILLAERPVKVGDMISIAGIEGDIRRISVRATQIQLADKSTVIVPNSQLISQNVRNVTMGNSTQGIASLVLTFSLDVDPERVRDILLDAFSDHLSVLAHPAPSVMFSQLTPDGITLTVTGHVRSPRIAADTRSELLFDILKRLRAAEIPLSNPRTVLIHAPHGSLPNAQGAVSGGPPRSGFSFAGATSVSENARNTAGSVEV